MIIRLSFIGLFLASVCCFITGCGGVGAVPVEGTIQYQGEPVAGIAVIFTPEDGPRPSYGSTNSEGHFVLNFSISETGVIPGKQAVTFDWEADREGEGMSEAIQAILEKHGEEGGEPLEIEITGAVKDLVINIE
jgi:hypothetical protein